MADPTLSDTFPAEFLSKRLGRVCRLLGIEQPFGDNHESNAEVAGTTLALVARKIEEVIKNDPSTTCCCGEFETCTKPCVPRAAVLKQQRDELLKNLRFAVDVLTPIAGHTVQVERMRAAISRIPGGAA